jgi:hypothetical protein
MLAARPIQALGEIALRAAHYRLLRYNPIYHGAIYNWRVKAQELRHAQRDRAGVSRNDL